MENKEFLKRWRLILGSDAEQQINNMGGAGLSAEELLMDSALSQIYGNDGVSGKGAGKAGGNGMSSPQITKWLGDLRSLFAPMEIKVIQNDAIERRGLKQLLFEPEMLDGLEPDISTASLLLMLKDQIPKRAKENARIYISKIVEDINRRLSDDLKRSVTAAVNRREHSPIPSAAALDYKLTVRRNLKNYSPELKTILPEKFYFFERASKSASRTIILDIDQSGSMGESVIYSSVMGCILASMNSVKTHIVAFDTKVTDLTELCSDPVELLYGIQLGGGTDIEKSVAYCSELVAEPDKTTMFLITDLYEGGNRNGLIRRIGELKESGVNIIVLLAISDRGKPCYDSSLAEKIASMDIPCFACPPEKLPELLELAIKRRSLNGFGIV
ncbi:MAG: VWA domain-containing protein [Oscillospiraceae bacterium]|nr:VWA domain-containing protein [Oscillospiraceae bacterium]MDD6081905.1 VWA domain-containing protein [Oscillospiraceae bacterium]